MTPTFARRLALLSLLLAAEARAATYTITTLVDDATTNGNCTLREALLSAASDTTHDLCVGDVGADTIVLEAVGTYPFTLGDISSAGRQLTIRGDGDHPRTDYVVDTAHLQRLIEVTGGAALTLDNFTIANGRSAAMGGAILVLDSDLTLRRMWIHHGEVSSLSQLFGAGVAFRATAPRTLDIEDVTFFQNWAQGAYYTAGGALDVDLPAGGTVRIVSTVFDMNKAFGDDSLSVRTGGAGLYVAADGDADVEVRHCTFSYNRVQIQGGGGGDGAGAYIRLANQVAGTLRMEDDDFFGNSLVDGGSVGLALSVDANGSNAILRRLRFVSTNNSTANHQVALAFSGASNALVSDLLVARDLGGGVRLATSGTSTLVGGNLTVTGQGGSGLRLAENGGTLRVENSIIYGNATSGGSNVEIVAGSPEVSAETLVGVDPHFVDAANADYRLQAGSPAENTGQVNFVAVGPYDLSHGDRQIGPGLDLGAYERGSLFSDDFGKGDLAAWSAAAP